MKIGFARNQRTQINRRAFLRGAGTVAIGLPFLESMPSRSAWAASSEPVFGLYICHTCGIVADKFWPEATGALTAQSMGGDGKAVGKLASHAERLLLVNGLRFPGGNSGCGHAQGMCQVLTGAASNGGGGNSATSTAPSVDTYIADAVNPSGQEPLTLYAGIKIGYLNEHISFSSAGKIRSAQGNPYEAYKDLVGLAPSSPVGMADPAEMMAVVDELSVRRKSVNDYVMEELSNLKAQSVLSQADRDRIDRHLDGLRDLEVGMQQQGLVGMSCNAGALDEAKFKAVSGKERQNGMQEEIAMLQVELVAFAFSCNLNRVATLQIGDGTDSTVYDVPSNSRRWGLHYLSHRTQSDGAVGNDQTAKDAHSEVDFLRMENFAKYIDIFGSYATATGNLLDNGYMVWTNHINDGPAHSFNNIPYLIAGNAGGYIKQGEYINLGGGGGGGGFGGGGSGPTNDTLLDTLKTASGVEGAQVNAELVVG